MNVDAEIFNLQDTGRNEQNKRTEELSPWNESLIQMISVQSRHRFTVLRSKLAELRVGVTAVRAHAAFGLAVSVSEEARFSRVRIVVTFAARKQVLLN